MKRLTAMLIVLTLMIRLLPIPIAAASTEEYDGMIVFDVEQQEQVMDENGNISGVIPIYIETKEKNVTMPDGSQFRYQYLAGDHHWFYEFVIVGGFSSYSGTVQLTPRLATATGPYETYYVSKRSDTIALKYSTKGLSILRQTGIVNGLNGKRYIVPDIPLYV